MLLQGPAQQRDSRRGLREVSLVHSRFVRPRNAGGARPSAGRKGSLEMIGTQGGAEGRIHSGRHLCSFKVQLSNAIRVGGYARSAWFTRDLFGRETPVELDLLQVEKVH